MQLSCQNCVVANKIMKKKILCSHFGKSEQ